MTEPLLTEEDRRIWNMWEMVCRRYARTDRHKRAVDKAMQVVREVVERAPRAYVACSGGKDSTALVALAAACGSSPRVMSVKDDLDFPGEEEHVRGLCVALGLDVDVLHPPYSLQDWLKRQGKHLPADEDFHGRGSVFSADAFYSVVDAYRRSQGSPGVYLGLRKDESYGRLMNRVTRGPIYEKADGEVVCQPLCDWTGMDVFAYLFEHDLPILPVYRCCRFHESPERIRKSWWLPGAHSRKGGMVWLKAYWPSLYGRLCEILPDASRLA